LGLEKGNNMNKKIIILLVLLAAFVILIILVRFSFNGGEDNWIKDNKGVYIRHGNPANVPDYVGAQQQIIKEATSLYNLKKSEGMQFSSQCLGTVGDYAVDIVHVPRIEDDNKIENQCDSFRKGKVSRFIELDKNGMIVRIA